MKQLGVLLLPLDGMLVHHRVPRIKHIVAVPPPPPPEKKHLQQQQHTHTHTHTPLDGMLVYQTNPPFSRHKVVPVVYCSK